MDTQDLNVQRDVRVSDVENRSLNDKSHCRFQFREIRPEEAEQLIALEHTCFPQSQAMPYSSMRELMAVAREFILVAIDSETEKIAAALFGQATNEENFRDAFFTDASLHHATGKNIMLLSLEVFPAYRGEGLARMLMEKYIDIERARGREELFLTCLAGKIGMYEKMGFINHGVSESKLGGETWYDMRFILK